MRPLPPNKSHGIVHSHRVVKQEDIDAIAKQLNIPDNKKKLIRPGDEIHVVREQRNDEVHTIREAKPGEVKP
jgi:DNA-directed RNA polymerase subunit H (RpoH/RPB5)